jgi:protein-L-isoaspartate(D-aspartate) O-methyltransferase
MHAKALELLRENLKNGKRALDVGSGSGYLTVAFHRMMARYNKGEALVCGIEHITPLAE